MKNKPIKKQESINKYYTFIYVYIPEYYYIHAEANPDEVLFAENSIKYGMSGGIKVGTTTFTSNNNPTEIDCKNAFKERYRATEDGISSILYNGMLIPAKKTTIDKEVRDIIVAVGNTRHPEQPVISSSDKQKCNSINNYVWYFYDDSGKHICNGTIRKIGKEYIYNVTKKDIDIALELINCITHNLSFSWECDTLLQNKKVIHACNNFRDKLSEEINHDSPQFHNIDKINNVLDGYNITNNIVYYTMHSKPDEQCNVLTAPHILEKMCSFIQNDKKHLSIAIIAKTPSDAIEISNYITNHCCDNIKYTFTYICAYPERQVNLLTNYKNKCIIYIDDKTYNQISNMKFDYIIQNPPYSSTLHIDYFEWGYYITKRNNSKMIIIQPASFYIDVRQPDKKSNSFRAEEIRNMLERDKAVSNIIIENYNYDFETNTYFPHAITFIDFTKKHNEIDFCCYGHHKKITSICNESNPFGNLNIINSILLKTNATFNDNIMSRHIVTLNDVKNNRVFPKGTMFLKYSSFIGASGGCWAGSYGKTDTKGSAFSSVARFDSKFGQFVTGYIAPNCQPTTNEISENVIYNNNAFDGSKGNKNIDNIFGTKHELETWIDNSKNNALMLFLNIVYTWDNHNHTYNIMPWLTDKIYSDKEIFDICNFTDEERKFIINIILKYRRDGEYFKRYILGINENLVNKLKSSWSNSTDSDIIDFRDKIHVIKDSEIENYIEQCKQEAQEYVKRNC